MSEPVDDRVPTEANEGNETHYRITEVPISDLKMIVIPLRSVGAHAPRYDIERDEPAFNAAWKHVAELRAQAKLTPVPPLPFGGFKVLRPRQKSAA